MSDPTPSSTPRPAQPVLGPTTARPDARSVRPRAAATPATVAPTRVIAVPVAKPARPSPWAAAAVRQTLVPPCLVLGVAAVGLGIAYFCQPADAALRQVSAVVAVSLLAAGGVTLAVAGLLMASLRRAAGDAGVN